MKNLLGIKPPGIVQLHDKRLTRREIALSVARLDEVHPLISGNKFYKLTYYLSKALKSPSPEIISFGGAYSNHLHALAFTAQALGIKSTGIIRGEKPTHLSPTLQDCAYYGMNLQFLSRNEYRLQQNKLLQIQDSYENPIIIPEGGFGEMGMQGAALMYDDIRGNEYTHIICACGTGTSIAGLLQNADSSQVITGISVLKGYPNLKRDILSLVPGKTGENLQIFHEFHFGGYAKYNADLHLFMNEWYRRFEIPSDFVYTGKLFFALDHLLEHGFFPRGSRILCIHSGGLQGNRSLNPGSLIF